MDQTPPPGGLGGPIQAGAPMGPLPPAPGKASSGSTFVVIVLAVGGGLFVILAVLAVLAIFGVRKFTANAKQAEARNAVAMMARGAAAAYEKEALERPTGQLCPSTASAVPKSIVQVAGKKYQSSAAEWSSDPGFSCLRFEMMTPQYYQYSYTSNGPSFVATAKGDIDGDGDLSTFELEGQVENSTLAIAPTIKVTDPDE